MKTSFRVIVGAPKANSSLINYQYIKEPGVVYSCPLDEKECKEIQLDAEGIIIFKK